MFEQNSTCFGNRGCEIESKPAALALLTLHYQAQASHNKQPRHHNVDGSWLDYHFLHRGRSILEIEVEKKISATYRSFKFLIDNGLLIPESHWGRGTDKKVAITQQGIRCHLCTRYRLFGIEPDFAINIDPDPLPNAVIPIYDPIGKMVAEHPE